MRRRFKVEAVAKEEQVPHLQEEIARIVNEQQAMAVIEALLEQWGVEITQEILDTVLAEGLSDVGKFLVKNPEFFKAGQSLLINPETAANS